MVVEGGMQYKCKVTGFEDVEGWEMSAAGCHQTLERCITIQYEDGDMDSIDKSSLVGWSYCEAPDEDALVDAMNERFNLDMELACAQCGCKTKKLHPSAGCSEIQMVYYCDQSCQNNHWEIHRADCKNMKTVLRPNPRYPLSEVSIFTESALNRV